MKKRMIALMLTCVLGGTMALYAAPLTADWIEGNVEYRSGSKWVKMEIGDSVDDKALVRLGKNSFAEFSSSGIRLVFTAEGSYNLAELAKPVAPGKTALANKLDRIVNHSAPRRSTVAGVRGNFEGRPDQTEWLGDEDSPTLYAEEGHRLMGAKDYAGAMDSFAEAVRLAFGQEKEEYSYNQALAAALAGKTIDAVKVLRAMPSSGPWYTSRTLLLAQLDLETGALAEADSLLTALGGNTAMNEDEKLLLVDLKKELASIQGKK